MNASEQASKWVETRFPAHKRPKYGDGDFSESDVEEAFEAGFAAGCVAAQPVGAIRWEYQSAGGWWEPCRNEQDAATWAEDGRKIRPAKASQAAEPTLETSTETTP